MVLQKWEREKLAVRLSDDVLNKIEQAKKNADGALPAVAADGTDGPTPQPITGPKVYTHHDFGRSAAGNKNLQDFLRHLPSKYGDEFDNILQYQGKKYVWEHIVLRAPDYFEVVKPSGNAKEFGKCVLQRLLSMLPTEGGKKAVGNFCKSVDYLAQPVLTT